MSVTTIATGIQHGAAVCALADGTIAVAYGPGVLERYDASGNLLDSLSVSAAPAALAAHPSGTAVLATSPASGVWEISFDTGAETLVRRLRGGRSLAVDPISATCLVGRAPSPALVQLHLGSGRRRLVTDELARPHAVAARTGATTAWVVVGGGDRRLVGIDLAGGEPGDRPRIRGLGTARDLAWTGSSGSVLAVADAAGRILLADTALADVGGGAGAVQMLEDGLDPVWSLDLLPPASPGDPAMLVAGIGDTLALVDLPAPVADVELEMPHEPLYLSGWSRVGVALHGNQTLDDLLFVVDPPEGGAVSVSRDAAFEHRPSVLLAASAVPGTYLLLALDKNSGDKLAVGEFTVTESWNGADGPPVAVLGQHGTDSPDPAWGGGDPFVPQNLNVIPQRGTRQVAVVIAETNEVPALSATEQATLRDEWQDEVFDGVVQGGVTESVAHYFRDVSDGKLELANAGVVGVVRLAQNWGSYVSAAEVETTGKTNEWAGFARAVMADLVRQNDAAAAAGDPPVVDLRTVQSIVLVLRSVPATMAGPGGVPPAFPGRFIWPSATRPGAYQLTFEIGRQTHSIGTPFGSFEVTTPLYRTIDMFTMPHDWTTRSGSGGRTRRETTAHEMGHNLGLPDEYARNAHDAAFQARDLAASTDAGASWSLMSWEETFPQMTVVEKMMLGWVEARHVKNLSFAALGPVNEDVTLHASNFPTPDGEFAAIEVRISDGVNYYFEYRQEKPAQTSDRDVPADDTVVGVHAWSGKEPDDHRNILRIQNDADNDQAEFQTGDDYREQDVSDPGYPNDFEMEVLSTGPRRARVHITYGDRKPDPQIRPWAPSTNWKSPDLEVVNDRNRADSRFRDIPWENHDNRIVATVRNPAGQLDAFDVRVDFFVKDLTLGGGREIPLGSDVHDVAAGTEVEFTSSVAWVPPPLSLIPFISIPVHYCVVARIAEYRDPTNPSVGEITRDNNEAQSNHTQVISTSASPSTRETGFVKVTNPLPVPARCRVQVRQTSEFARTYLERAWVRLGPGEERDVMFLTESVLGDPLLGQRAREFRERIYKDPNRVRLTGIADEAGVCEGFVTGGTQVLVRAARATHFTRFESDDGLVHGEVSAVDNGQGADGTILVSIWPPDAPEKGKVREGMVTGGKFRVETGRPPDGWFVQGHYLGSFDLSPCDSKIVVD